MAPRPLTALCLLLALVATAQPTAEELETEATSSYIVHVAPAHAAQPPPRHGLLTARAYASFLRDHIPVHMSSPAPRVLYSYAHASTGFSARLTERQAAHLASQRSVLAVVPSKVYRPHTTLTPSFLGLSPSSGLLPASKGARNVVIGLLDSGVYPIERASFAADPSLPPPLSKFRGGCVSTQSFNTSAYCNNKLVGAKFFCDAYEAEHGRIDEKSGVMSRSPLDTEGHGTHTASTAAGSAVSGASFFDYAKGEAVGMAPSAKIAVYKVCWNGSCNADDVLAGIEAAIADGVDIISMSIGSGDGDLWADPTAVGAFRAVRKGILVSASAGNSGPSEATVANTAPWILTVGASTINRQFPVDVVLGNNKTYTGTALYTDAPLGVTKIPLVYGRQVGSANCKAGKLDATKVAGKIVLCEGGNMAAKGEAVKIAGGVGVILAGLMGAGEDVKSVAHVLPAASVTFLAAVKIIMYILADPSPVATIVSRGTVIGGKSTPPSPRMATFSSRGPNRHAMEILKPDVTAPGVNILAAWTGANSPSALKSDTRRVKYNILSGTSMSCPHVSGIAAMLQQAHPTWSPAAIKSALMTTAYNVDSSGAVIGDMSTGKASTPFVRGAGHVDPNRAANPGLVYDAGSDEYISFMCALGYTAEQVAIFTGDGSVTHCSERTKDKSDKSSNYPAFSVVFGSDKRAVTQYRFVTNVGDNLTPTYSPRITSPPGVRVTVRPNPIRFPDWWPYRNREYKVTFEPETTEGVTEKYSFGSIEWSDGEHTVTSPIAITWAPTSNEIAEM